MNLWNFMFLPLKELIDNGTLSIDDAIVNEQKDRMIDILYDYHIGRNVEVSKTEIGLWVDKVFEEELNVR